MTKVPLTIERRRALTSTIRKDTVSCVNTLHKTYFGPDVSSDSVQMLIEAFGGAIVDWAKTKPQGTAILHTFIRELQDSLETN